MMYGRKGASQKDAQELNGRYAPEVVVAIHDKKSHMYDAELFLWYLDVVLREALRQQRRRLVHSGRSGDASRKAVLRIDAASCSQSYGTRGPTSFHNPQIP